MNETDLIFINQLRELGFKDAGYTFQDIYLVLSNGKRHIEFGPEFRDRIGNPQWGIVDKGIYKDLPYYLHPKNIEEVVRLLKILDIPYH